MTDRAIETTIENSSHTAIVNINIECKLLAEWYLNEEQKNINIMESALIDEDFNSIIHIGHNMYGHGITYGFSYISKIGRSIEFAAIKKDSKLLYCLIEALRTYLQNVQIHYV